MGRSEGDCKKRWKGLRDTMAKELRKTKEKKSGDAGPEYVSRWAHFDGMLFVKDCIWARKYVVLLV